MNTHQTPAPIVRPQHQLFAGEWQHLFGPGKAQTRCRVVLDATSEAIVHAQAWNGTQWLDLGRAEVLDLADSMINVNGVLDSLDDWDFTPVAAPPAWTVAL